MCERTLICGRKRSHVRQNDHTWERMIVYGSDQWASKYLREHDEPARNHVRDKDVRVRLCVYAGENECQMCFGAGFAVFDNKFSHRDVQ